MRKSEEVISRVKRCLPPNQSLMTRIGVESLMSQALFSILKMLVFVVPIHKANSVWNSFSRRKRRVWQRESTINGAQKYKGQKP
ncbi:MAG: hypothetical protein HYV28_18815 [Ignavibacteriales bacterium]|nr:hypothetical protein [Ignavibacteriales bacterium]